MKRSELEVGVEYAIGSRASYATRHRATYQGPGEVTYRHTPRWGGEEEDRQAKGLLFTLAEHARAGVMGSDGVTLSKDDARSLVLPNAGLVVATWADYELIEERRQADLAEAKRKREEVSTRAEALRERLVAAGMAADSFVVRTGDRRVSVEMTEATVLELIARLPDGEAS